MLEKSKLQARAGSAEGGRQTGDDGKEPADAEPRESTEGEGAAVAAAKLEELQRRLDKLEVEHAAICQHFFGYLSEQQRQAWLCTVGWHVCVCACIYTCVSAPLSSCMSS